MNSKDLARMIDHTALKPEATPKDIEQLCAEAKQFGFASVCVNPSYVKLCAELLKNTEVKICTVIGFPLGATTSAMKMYEAEESLKNGAREVDMVLNIGMLKSGNEEYVQNDIAAVVHVAHQHNAITKVILETCLLTDEEKIKACMLASKAGAEFVKTSTGFSKNGATIDDIVLMRRTVGAQMGVKASGGIRTQEQALAFIAVGASRIGTSAGIKIVTGE